MGPRTEKTPVSLIEPREVSPHSGLQVLQCQGGMRQWCVWTAWH